MFARADALRELIRRAEDVDADAIIRLITKPRRHGIDEIGVKLKRVVATGIAAKVPCAA